MHPPSESGEVNDHKESQELSSGQELEVAHLGLGSSDLEDLRALDDKGGGQLSAHLPECDIASWMTEEKFADIDGDGNGFLTREELKEAIQSGNYSESDKLTLGYMRRGNEIIEEASNDEWFDENDGITFNDTQKYKPYSPDLEFSPVSDMFAKDDMVVWASTMAEKIDFPNDEGQNYTNAFRHVLTTSMYALKYGDRAAMTLADSNELFTGARDTGEEVLVDLKNVGRELLGKDPAKKDTSWRYDTRADDYNNQVGLEIARDLRKVAEETGEPVSIDQLLNRVVESVYAGKAITNIHTGENQFGNLLQEPGVKLDKETI